MSDGEFSVDWLHGPLADGELTATNEGGGSLTATIDGDTARGTFVRPGEDALDFTAELVEEPAGLYRATATFDDGYYIGGWVILPDGAQRGSIRRYETPLPLGSVDTELDIDTLRADVPAGVLEVERVDPTAPSVDLSLPG